MGCNGFAGHVPSQFARYVVCTNPVLLMPPMTKPHPFVVIAPAARTRHCSCDVAAVNGAGENHWVRRGAEGAVTSEAAGSERRRREPGLAEERVVSALDVAVAEDKPTS